MFVVRFRRAALLFFFLLFFRFRLFLWIGEFGGCIVGFGGAGLGLGGRDFDSPGGEAVRGGDQHDYLLHGSAAEDSTAKVTGVTLAPFSGTLMNQGTKFKYPTGESSGVGNAGGYGFVRKLSAGKAGLNVTLDLRLSSNPNIGTRTHLLCTPGTAIYTGEAPRIRQAERKDYMLSRFWAPFFCARRKGKDLRSVFIAVHAPVNGDPKVKTISATSAAGGVLITVDRGQLGRDYFVMAFDGTTTMTAKTADGSLRFEGAYGLAQVRDGKCVEARLIGGKRLALGNRTIATTPGWRGIIRNLHRENGKNSRGYFEVAEAVVPANTDAALIVEFPDKTVRAYNIARTEKLERGTRIHVVEDPGYAVTGKGIELLTYPQRIIKGKQVGYRLPSVAHAADE